jgi:hypothetical protein
MSEVAAFNEYYGHARGCTTCSAGKTDHLCADGRQLWKAWRDAADADQVEQKREEKKRAREDRGRTRSPAPPRKVVHAGGRPRPPVEAVR